MKLPCTLLTIAAALVVAFTHSAQAQKRDKFGNIIPDGPPPAGLERPITTGTPPLDLGAVKLVQAAPPIALERTIDTPAAPGARPAKKKTDKFGNVIPQGPPPAGLEKPLDAPAPPAAPRPVLAPGQTAADLAQKKSIDQGGGEVTLTVTNATGAPIRVDWIDPDGKEGVSDDVIAAGQRFEMGTTGAGHFFRARDAKSKALLQEFRVKNNGGKFEITITGAARNGAALPAVARGPGAAPAQQDVAAFLKVHNDARAAVGVQPLQWSDTLAAYAQEWANRMAATNKFDHRSNGIYGENLAGYNPPDGPDAGARMWLAEKKDYRGQVVDGQNFMKFGHYTQMVWRKTTHVGYGVARMPDGMWVVVANYEPGGNMQGEHPYKP